jgi:TctA family transporter
MAIQPIHPRPHLLDEQSSFAPDRAVWRFLISIVIAKVMVVSVVLARDFSGLSLTYVALTSWFWVIAAAMLLSGPVSLAYRLRRTRARRAALLRAEWLVETGDRVDGSRHTSNQIQEMD